jgi:hypothetical protein
MPSSLPKRRRRIPTIVPSYRPVLRRHQLIVESSGPLVVIVSCVPYNIAILPYHIVILYGTILCEKYCNIPYCRIRRDAPPITATPSSLPKRRRRIPTIVPSYRPVLRRHQLIVESSGPLVIIVSCVPYNIAILPYHIVILYHIM